MKTNEFQTPITLARYIKWTIGNRIILCLVLLTIAIFFISLYDIINGFNHIKRKLDGKCNSIAEFIIAQSLIDNEMGIKYKFEELNSPKDCEHYTWHGSASTNLAKPEIYWHFPFSWRYVYPVIDNDGKSYGFISVTGYYSYDKTGLIQIVTKIILLNSFALMIFILLYPLSNRIPRELFIVPIMNLLDLLKTRAQNIPAMEEKMLPLELKEIQHKINDLMKEIRDQTRQIAFAQIATQIAHDIRSPLTALDLVINKLSSLPEVERALIRNATHRIRDIAHNLLSLHRQQQVKNIVIENKLSIQLITELIESVIAEKRIQSYGAKIDFKLLQQNPGYSFVEVSAGVFKRALSNLLDNAIEAIQHTKHQLEKGEIHISVENVANMVKITIADNGCGIPDDILTTIRAGKQCSTKSCGNGLGLVNAIKIFTETFKGKFFIRTEKNKGTDIEIELPLVPAPNVFATHIYMTRQTSIAVLDDDETMHQVWRKRFSDLNVFANIISFTKADEFISWQQKNLLPMVVFFIDFELLGSNKNGLDIIKECGIADQSFLVTSLFNDHTLVDACSTLKVKLLPKSHVSNIPIKELSHDDTQPDIIFLDDDQSITQAWGLVAVNKQVNLLTFNKIEELRSALPFIKNKTMPVYIDVIFNGMELGIQYAQELYERGFQSIYLTTGLKDEHRYNTQPWIKGVIDKEPPF